MILFPRGETPPRHELLLNYLPSSSQPDLQEDEGPEQPCTPRLRMLFSCSALARTELRD